MAASGATVASFPVQYSVNERYLVDQNSVPFPILGRTAWFVTSLSVTDYQTFVDDTASRGYNSIELHVVNHDPRGNHPPFNGNGDLPFTHRLDGATWDGSLVYQNINNQAPDLTTPNEAYWSLVDGLISYCESKGVLVFFFPAYAGYQGGEQGWMQEMVANGPARMQSYGAWIATRYRNQRNLVWMMGGDLGTFNMDQNNVESALLAGLKSVAGQQSIHFSAEWSSGMVATDQPTFGAAMTLNGVYSWEGDVNFYGRHAYSHTSIEPAFLLEEPYDQEGPDGNGYNPNATQPVRRFQWWGWLSTTGGYISGNGYVWPFRAPDWHDHLDTQGSRDMARLNAFINSIRWYKLVPSGLNGMRTLITAGGSTVSASNYVAASAAFDGTMLIAYVPPAHHGSITVDMTAMSGVTDARWFDPTSAAYVNIATGLPNTGTHVFTPPGNNSTGENDWVLVLQTEQAPDIEPPTVTLTAPIAGTIVSNTVVISATASDNVGVVGVRFQVDGVNVGAELLSPPYTTTWNTHDVPDGLHVVRANSRDLAENAGFSAVTVTVTNSNSSPTPSPTATATVTPAPSSTPSPIPTATPSITPGPGSQTINLSTRMNVQSGDNAGIGGFIITGIASKQVLLRAIGPSLVSLGVPDPLADPVLELHGPGGFLTITNDNWRDDPIQAALIQATGLAPSNDLESAIDVTLLPGAYTAIVRGNSNSFGVGLVEVYDLGQTTDSKLANISTRAVVRTDNDIMIAGFILGNQTGADRVIVRGIGPSLGALGVPNPLPDPTLELRDNNGTLILANNNWQVDPLQAALISAAGLAPPSPLESGIAVTLAPGPYTVLLAGLNNGIGVGLVEVYDLGATP